MLITTLTRLRSLPERRLIHPSDAVRLRAKLATEERPEGAGQGPGVPPVHHETGVLRDHAGTQAVVQLLKKQ